MTIRPRLIAAIVVAAGLAFPIAAAAQPSEAADALAKQRTVRALIAQSNTAAAGGDHVRAIRLLEQAYALIPHPMLLFNLGRAHHQAGDHPRAADHYRRFLASHPTGEQAELAAQWLAELDAETAAPPVPETPPPAPPPTLHPAFDPAVDRALARRQQQSIGLMVVGGAAALGGFAWVGAQRDDNYLAPVLVMAGTGAFIAGRIMGARAETARERARKGAAIAPAITSQSVGLTLSWESR